MDPAVNPVFIAFVALSPLLIALVKQSGLSTSWNAVIAMAGYLLVGIAGAAYYGIPLTVDALVPFIATVVVIGTAAYNLLWRNLGADSAGGSLDHRIEAVTSLIRPTP